MKKKILGVMIVIVLVSLVLAACGGGGDNAANGGTGDAPAADTVEGEALVLEKLEAHHDADRIFNATKTREEWDITLDRMINTYGAKINEEEKQAIIDYLVSR